MDSLQQAGCHKRHQPVLDYLNSAKMYHRVLPQAAPQELQRFLLLRRQSASLLQRRRRQMRRARSTQAAPRQRLRRAAGRQSTQPSSGTSRSRPQTTSCGSFVLLLARWGTSGMSACLPATPRWAVAVSQGAAQADARCLFCKLSDSLHHLMRPAHQAGTSGLS